MDTSFSSVSSPIATTTARCLSEFRQILTLLDVKEQPVYGISSAAIQEDLGRFQSIESKVSLDYRLHRDGSHLSAHFVSRLTELEETLKESKSIVKPF
jgi:hypothetical protein